jgi:hypothetical protein
MSMLTAAPAPSSGRHIHRAPMRQAAFVLCLLCAFLSGCDIVQGFRNTGDAIFPPEQNYLDVPGFRMVEGGYKDLVFAAGTDLYLLARSADASDGSLYAMNYADPKVCAIGNVGQYQPGFGVYQGPAMVGYFEGTANPGTLHFADANCHPYPFTVPGAFLPMDESSEGFALFSGGDLVFVDPVAGTTKSLVQSVQGIAWHVLGDVTLVQAGDRLGAFGPNGTELGWFGGAVVRSGRAGSYYFFEDGDGVHRLAAQGGSPPTVTDTVVAQGGCSFVVPSTFGASESWILYHPSCGDPAIAAYGVSSEHVTALGFDVDPRFVVLSPVWPKTDGDPGVDPFVYLYLKDVDSSLNLGTLVLRGPDNQEHVLGDHADLGRASLFGSATGLHGYALVGADATTGTFVGFAADGTTTELAQQVLRGTSDLIVNFDGQMGDFALPTDSGVSVVAQHVPSSGFLLRDRKGRWTATLHDYEGPSASLSVSTSSLDFFEAAATPGPAPTFEAIATGVARGNRTQFLTSLPGIAYLTNDDAEQDTGTLRYRNLELEFTGTVSDGLSDYISNDDGLIYAIPSGPNAGIWAVRAR